MRKVQFFLLIIQHAFATSTCNWLTTHAANQSNQMQSRCAVQSIGVGHLFFDGNWCHQEWDHMSLYFVGAKPATIWAEHSFAQELCFHLAPFQHRRNWKKQLASALRLMSISYFSSPIPTWDDAVDLIPQIHMFHYQMLINLNVMHTFSVRLQIRFKHKWSTHIMDQLTPGTIFCYAEHPNFFDHKHNSTPLIPVLPSTLLAPKEKMAIITKQVKRFRNRGPSRSWIPPSLSNISISSYIGEEMPLAPIGDGGVRVGPRSILG